MKLNASCIELANELVLFLAKLKNASLAQI